MRSRNTKGTSSFRRLGCGEQLERREMLSGHGLSTAFSFALAEFGSHAAAATPAAHVAAQVSSANAVSLTTSSETVLSAQLTDSSGTATGTAYYSTGTASGVTETEFKVSVTGATASTTLDVSVGGTVVGQITTDTTGAGKLILSSNPVGSNKQALPANFPTTVAAGTAVTVGTLSGSLVTPTQSSSGCGAHSGTTLTATLADPTNTSAAGTATYWTGTIDGTTVTKLKVSVTGATASSTLNVSVDGTIVGQVTTDSTGAGALILSSDPQGSEQQLPTNFPTTVAAGSTVTVGSITGRLAASTTPTASDSFHSFFRRR